VIGRRDLDLLRAEWSLDLGVIEKDYVLGWLLAGIAAHPALSGTWVFKGGTCLRKCYYETFRFSEDLDFTVTGAGPEQPGDLLAVFTEIAAWVREQSGLELVVDDRCFRRRRNRRGHPTAEGRIGYRGPNPPPTLPKVKLDLTSDEILVHDPVRRPIGHPYPDVLPDGGQPGGAVLSYAIADLFAEKLRALAERCRPRDLYDVVHLHRHPDLIGRAGPVRSALDAKCAHTGIDVPTLESIQASPFRAEIEHEWVHMLGHQLPQPLPTFTSFWTALDRVFSWLAGTPAPRLPRALPAGVNVDPEWRAPTAISSWHAGLPLELLRYAGANRLLVDLDYRTERGRQGVRRVAPYSLRRSRDGHLLLFVVNDSGQLRSYRVDHIAGIRPTTVPFTPRYQIEL
jgi:predicted nucleotidyltransferase component of viral defense system